MFGSLLKKHSSILSNDLTTDWGLTDLRILKYQQNSKAIRDSINWKLTFTGIFELIGEVESIHLETIDEI